MPLSFSKYSGCGNDFILVDNRLLHFPVDAAYIAKLCDRKRGVGADGLILLQLSQMADYRMRIFNADGGEAEMCGNGIRCLMQFIRELGGLAPRYRIETMNATLQVEEEQGGLVSVEMAEPHSIQWELSLPGFFQLSSLNTGVPHAVIFVEDLERDHWMAIAPQIRHHAAFGPKGTNVNFAQLKSDGTLSVRTYERGVEGETLACGTGATAAALAAAKRFGLPGPIQVLPRSKEPLNISFSWQGDCPTAVTLAGPAHFIFRGFIN